MFNYWFIFIIFVPIGIFLGRKFWDVYGINPLNAFIDFFGLASMFNTPTMNATWWFMSAIIMLYILFPIFVRIMSFSSELMLSIAAALVFLPKLSSCPFIGKFFVWILPFAVGMYLAKYDGMEKLHKHNNTMGKGLCFTGVMIIVCTWVRNYYGQTCDFDSLFALSIILFSYFVLSKIPFVNIVLEHLGKHSGSIFMMHTFIYLYYFKEIIYWFRFSPIILIVMTAVCYCISVGLEYVKRITRYNRLVENVLL